MRKATEKEIDARGEVLVDHRGQYGATTIYHLNDDDVLVENQCRGDYLHWPSESWYVDDSKFAVALKRQMLQSAIVEVAGAGEEGQVLLEILNTEGFGGLEDAATSDDAAREIASERLAWLREEEADADLRCNI